jgi:hypothetical protein
VKTQVGAIYAKLGVGDRRGAVVAAYDAGLLPTPFHDESSPDDQGAPRTISLDG